MSNSKGTIDIFGQVRKIDPVRYLTVINGTDDFLPTRGLAACRLVLIDRTPPPSGPYPLTSTSTISCCDVCWPCMQVSIPMFNLVSEKGGVVGEKLDKAHEANITAFICGELKRWAVTLCAPV
ncbi:hypothetical protein L7F22_068704 [Adiantum nelumboides]|nr:hypothetical protein [Adiantum nelumboides]